jgi:hypothetical protein
MPSPAVTYTFSNSTTADAGQVNTNFSDLISGMTDGTKDFSINALTLAGALTANGNVTLGNASSDTITLTGSVASSVSPNATGTLDLGGASLGWAGLYLAASADADTARIIAASHTADRTYTVPDAGTDASFVMTAVAQTVGGVKTFSDGIKLDDAGGQTTLNFFEEGTWTPAQAFSGGNGTSSITPATNGARYTRIGRSVWFTLDAAFSRGTGSGTLTITGLPYTSAATAVTAVTIGIYPITLPGTESYLAARVDANTTTLRPFFLSDSGLADYTSSNMESTWTIMVSGWYSI